MRHYQKFAIRKNVQFLSDLHETWSKYLPHEVIKSTKFHEDRTKIVHFFFWRKLSPVYAMKRATFNLIFHIIKVLPHLWGLGIQKDIDWRFLKK